MLRVILVLAALALPAAAQSQAQAQQAKPMGPPAKPQVSAFDGIDANKDGKISKAEFIAARSARFDQLDRNHDGKIDRADFPQAANHQAALRRLDAQIASADANKDGSVSRQELAHAQTPFFDKFDTNHDGFVDKAEADAARAKAQAAAARKRGG